MKNTVGSIKYLALQYRYDIFISWLINSFIMFALIALSFIVPEHVNFGITPSIAMYVVVIVFGVKWIGRTLSYLLRLGVNRRQYSVGSVLFTLLYSLFNSILVALFYLLFNILEYYNLNTSILFLHPVSILVEQASFFNIVLFDFILFNIAMLIAMLFSIAYHRIGKLGGHLTLAIVAVIIIVNLAFNGISSLFTWIMELESNFMLVATGILIIVISSLIFLLSTKRISIQKSSL